MCKFHSWIANQMPVTLLGNEHHYSAAIRQASEEEASRALEAINGDVEAIVANLHLLYLEKDPGSGEYYEEVKDLTKTLVGALEIRDKITDRLGRNRPFCLDTSGLPEARAGGKWRCPF